MILRLIAFGTVITIATVFIERAGYVNIFGTNTVTISDLWQEIDLTNSPEVVQEMDSCLRRFSEWQTPLLAATQPWRGTFRCNVNMSELIPPAEHEKINDWLALQLGGNSLWQPVEQDIVDVCFGARMRFSAAGTYESRLRQEQFKAYIYVNWETPVQFENSYEMFTFSVRVHTTDEYQFCTNGATITF